MKNKALWVALGLLVLALGTGWISRQEAPSTHEDTDKEIRQRVAAIMAKMDLKDKVGEMTQLSLDMLSVGQPYSTVEPHQLDSAKLREVLVDYRVGSILNITNKEFSVEHWREIIKTIQRIATTEKASGIPVLYGIDAIHGVNYTEGANLHPQELGLASSWNLEMARELSAMTAYQCRASYIPWNFNPVLDIGRDPRWPRLWETLGEDVYLAKTLGVAMVEGLQGDDIKDDYQVAACMKHFLGYSYPKRGKDRTAAWIPERQLKEYFVPTFQAAVDAGAASIMICSGEINGIPVHADPEILIDLLRKEMGFEGLAVTDWSDIRYLHERHKVAKDYKESIKQAINAGIDMSMVPIDLDFPRLLKELVEEGEVPMSRIDEAVERILTLKVRLGLFENPYPKAEYPDFGADKYSELCLEAARQSLVLVKNEEAVLPLKKGSKVLVTGPTANSLVPLNGGWTHTWQGDVDSLQTKGKKTILQAIQSKLGEKNVSYVPGTAFDKNKKDMVVDIKAAVRAARKAQTIILCLGENSYTETPGDIPDLELAGPQQKLVMALAKLGKPMVAVMAQGRPRIISAIEAELDAVLLSFLPGDEGGMAIADVLFGDVNPSGKLAITYPRSSNDLVNYDHKGTDETGPLGFNPQYEFGHGLSYTSFSYDKLKLNQKTYRKNDPIKLSIELKNTGNRAGTEVVQVYIQDQVASITPAVKRLRAYRRESLEAGASKTVEFTIMPEELSFIGRDNKWTLESGMFTVMVGGKKMDFELQ